MENEKQSQENITIELHNPLGQKIASIYNGRLFAGENKYSWNIENKIEAGTYFVKINLKEKVISQIVMIQ